MSDTIYPDQSTVVHYDPNWIRAQQPAPFLHRNNILFYFMTSPFFDPSSRNSEVMSAQQDFPHWQSVVATVDSFQREMSLRPGLEFVLAHDPETTNTMIEPPPPPPNAGAPPGGRQLMRSNLFVIRKQRRLEDLRSTVPMGVYWCMNDRVFQAPSVGNVLNARVLGMGAGLGRVLERLNVLVERQLESGKKAGKRRAGSVGGGSNEGTPVPGGGSQVDVSGGGKVGDVLGGDVGGGKGDGDEEQGFNTLGEALRMTLKYGKEYADEMTLAGEPGNFRFIDSRLQPAGAAQNAATKQLPAIASRQGTPAQARVVSGSGMGRQV